MGVSGCGGSAVEVDETPDCCSSHLFQIESFFSGTMMIGPVAPMICTGAAGSSRLPLFRCDVRVANCPRFYVRADISSEDSSQICQCSKGLMIK